MLDAEAVAFKKTVFDWEAQLLQKAMLDEEQRCFQEHRFLKVSRFSSITVLETGPPSRTMSSRKLLDREARCSRAAELPDEQSGFQEDVFDWEAQLLFLKAVLDEEAVAFKKTVFDWEVQLLQ